jgi:hypothetical protein
LIFKGGRITRPLQTAIFSCKKQGQLPHPKNRFSTAPENPFCSSEIHYTRKIFEK